MRKRANKISLRVDFSEVEPYQDSFGRGSKRPCRIRMDSMKNCKLIIRVNH